MDPLSLTCAATALVTLCVQVGWLCTRYISDVSDIDGVVADLAIEVSALGDILANFKSTLEADSFANARLTAATGHEGEHWRCVDGVLAGCKGTLTDLGLVLDKASRDRKHLRRARTHLALNKADTKIASCKLRIQSYKDSLQISLQILSLSTQLDSAESINRIQPRLDDLQSLINRVLTKVESLEQGAGNDTTAIQALETVKSCIRSANTILSSASTALSSTGSAIATNPDSDSAYGSGGSTVMHDDSSHENVVAWVSTHDSPVGFQDIDDHEHFQTFFSKRAASEDEAGDFERAELLYNKALVSAKARLAKSARPNPKDMAEYVELCLALSKTSCKLQKWIDARETLTSAQKELAPFHPVLFQRVKLATILVDLDSGDIDEADRGCSELMKHIRQDGDKSYRKHPLFSETVQLKAKVLKMKGNNDDADAYNALLATTAEPGSPKLFKRLSMLARTASLKTVPRTPTKIVRARSCDYGYLPSDLPPDKPRIQLHDLPIADIPISPIELSAEKNQEEYWPTKLQLPEQYAMQELRHATQDNNDRSLNSLISIHSPTQDQLNELLLYAVAEGLERVVITLSSNGADVNHQHHISGWTPLHMAVHSEHADMVRALVSSGADIFSRDASGFTPMQLAFTQEMTSLCLEMIRLSSQDETSHSLNRGNSDPGSRSCTLEHNLPPFLEPPPPFLESPSPVPTPPPWRYQSSPVPTPPPWQYQPSPVPTPPPQLHQAFEKRLPSARISTPPPLLRRHLIDELPPPPRKSRTPVLNVQIPDDSCILKLDKVKVTISELVIPPKECQDPSVFLLHCQQWI